MKVIILLPPLYIYIYIWVPSILFIKVYKIKIYVTETFIFLLTLKFYFIGYYDCKGFNYRHLKSPTSIFIGTCSKLIYIYYGEMLLRKLDLMVKYTFFITCINNLYHESAVPGPVI